MPLVKIQLGVSLSCTHVLVSCCIYPAYTGNNNKVLVVKRNINFISKFHKTVKSGENLFQIHIPQKFSVM